MSNQNISASTETPDGSSAPIPFGNKLAATAFMCVMLGGGLQVILATRKIEWSDVPHTRADFTHGISADTLGKQIDQKLPLRPALIAGANSLRYLLLRGGGDQVRAGRENWLFLTEELSYHADANSHLDARADLLGAASSALEREGVKLVVALVPDKVRIYPQHVRGGMPEFNRTRYQDAIHALQTRGVNVVDLLKPLALAAAAGEVYYRTDTHWNQSGALVAAKAIAAEVRRLSPDLETTLFATEKDGVEAGRPGDLIRLMGLENTPDFLRPQPDRETLLLTRQTSAENSGGLFGDASVPVVLTGTSYSLRANFHGFLQQELAAKVLNTAKDGGGFLQSTTEYLKDESFRTSKPKIIIWELPERFLGMKLEEEPKWLQTVGLHN